MREAWREKISGLDLSRLIFIDESGAKTNMTRLYARALGGQRAVDPTPHGHWSTTTMISALRVDGSSADMVIDSATDGTVFLTYVQKILAPTLKANELVMSAPV